MDFSLKACADPEAVFGCGYDHPGVDGALDRTSGQLAVKRLFEELIGGGLNQLNQIWAEGVAVFLEETSKRDGRNKNNTEDLDGLLLLKALKVPFES